MDFLRDFGWSGKFLQATFSETYFNWFNDSYKSRINQCSYYGLIPAALIFIFFVITAVLNLMYQSCSRGSASKRRPTLLNTCRFLSFLALASALIILLLAFTLESNASSHLSNAIQTSWNNGENLFDDWKKVAEDYEEIVGDPGTDLIDSVDNRKSSSRTNQSVLESYELKRTLTAFALLGFSTVLIFWMMSNCTVSRDNFPPALGALFFSALFVGMFGISLAMSLSTWDICTGVQDEEIETYSLVVQPLDVTAIDASKTEFDADVQTNLDDLNALTSGSYDFNTYSECNPDDYTGDEVEVQELIDNLDELKELDADLNTFLYTDDEIFLNILDENTFCDVLWMDTTSLASSQLAMGISLFAAAIIFLFINCFSGSEDTGRAAWKNWRASEQRGSRRRMGSTASSSINKRNGSQRSSSMSGHKRASSKPTREKEISLSTTNDEEEEVSGGSSSREREISKKMDTIKKKEAELRERERRLTLREKKAVKLQSSTSEEEQTTSIDKNEESEQSVEEDDIMAMILDNLNDTQTESSNDILDDSREKLIEEIIAGENLISD